MSKHKPKLAKVASLPLKNARGDIPAELIAARAYELWLQRGCPLGEDKQDWFAARAELECDLNARGTTSESAA